MNSFQHELDVAQAIAREAGETMRQYFDGNQQKEIKKDGSPVTIADKKVNQLVIDRLSFEFPEDGVIGEEASNTEHGMGRKWICDPIDGTKAFTWGVPTAMFSLGLVIDGRPRAGVVYDPFLDRIYTAIKGQGSFCNGQKLAVSQESLQNGTVAVASSVKEITRLPYIQHIPTPVTFSGPIYKSTLVAKGRFVGFVEAGPTDHDMAAVELIVNEAGGMVTNMSGEQLDYSKPFAGVVVTNGVIHEELLHIISV